MRYIRNWLTLSAPAKGRVAGTEIHGAIVEINESDLNYISKLLQEKAASEIMNRKRFMSPGWRPRSDRLWRKIQAIRHALKNDMEA